MSFRDAEIHEDIETGEDMKDDKSVAMTDIVPYKSPMPSSMQQIGLSPRATENLRVSYAILNREQLKEVLKKDGDVLNERFKVMKLSVDSVVEAQADIGKA